MIAKSAQIAPTAIIESGAQIGENVKIGHFCHISSEAKIGNNCILHNSVVIAGNTTLGEENEVFPFAVLGTKPQDLKFKGEKNALIFGAKNQIREHVMINPGTAENPTATTQIGSCNLLMAYVHIAHDCVVGDNCILANNATLAGHVELGSFVNIGGLTPIHQFVKIGSYSMIGGGSALSQDVPPFCLAQGNHAKIRGLNLHLLRRHFERAEIDVIHNAFSQIFSGKKPYKELAAEILENSNSQNVKKFCEFVISSKRGVPFVRNSKSEEN